MASVSRARDGTARTQPCRRFQGPLERGSQDPSQVVGSQAQAGITGGDEYRLRVGTGAFIKKKKRQELRCQAEDQES